ncbi:MAG: hypothetical protein JSU72_15130 [Deltaproteobacteria bacterium]|nr:MAG: hypothetical protein JSU72_15130 [Deltaproteobacteria bacterium]
MRKRIQNVLAMLSPRFDWERHWEKEDALGIEDEFRKCVRVFSLTDEGDYHNCGSYKGENTPKELYRLFYLLEPKVVDFSNMYRGDLFAFVSTDERFLVKVSLFEYELGLYFFAPEETIDKTDAVCVPSAWPGADNRIRCTDPVGVAFFEMVQKIVQHEYEVYPVGEFRV